MTMLTFEQISDRVARHQAAEALRNAPVAVARRAVYSLASALADLNETERCELRELLAEEMAELVPIVA